MSRAEGRCRISEQIKIRCFIISLYQKSFSKPALPMQPATNADHLSPDLSKVCLAEAFKFRDISVQYWSIIPLGGGSRKLL